jgi:TolA-binding protein|tara:strand:+ start:176 stop:514 length:339 start_codon:yes stop_codon:yes gene_type:complete
MEIWIFFLVFIVAGLGLLAMLGYVKNETDRLELKHFMATAEFKREMVEVQAQHAIKVEQDRETIEGLNLRITELNIQIDEEASNNRKLQSSLDKLREDLAEKDPASDDVVVL